VPSNRVLRRLWRPPAETLEALGSVLGAHWRAAARTRTARLFSPANSSWLRGRATVTAPSTNHHFTTGGRLIR
jgi:hypothetical protein